MKYFYILLTCSLIFSCSGGGSGSSGSTTPTDTNKFTATGTSATINDLVSTTSTSNAQPLSTSAQYYGRFLSTDGSFLYSGTVRFSITKESDSTAYFTSFYLDYLSKVSFSSPTVIVSSQHDPLVPTSYDSSDNHISIADGTSRFISFKINFGDNTYVSDIPTAGMIFSSDLTTIVGGDNLSFFFIAQKTSSQPAVSTSDLEATWKLANFTVSSSGGITVTSTSTVTVGGTGGNGYTAYTGTHSTAGNMSGEIALTDSTSGAFVYGPDPNADQTTPTASSLYGGFLLSADKNFVLGVDAVNGIYFAASK
jgi:hypothetical protein